MTGEAELYKSGHRIFSGSFSEMIQRLREELGHEPGYTKKIKASLEGLPPEEGEIYEDKIFDSDVADFFHLRL